MPHHASLELRRLAALGTIEAIINNPELTGFTEAGDTLFDELPNALQRICLSEPSPATNSAERAANELLSVGYAMVSWWRSELPSSELNRLHFELADVINAIRRCGAEYRREVNLAIDRLTAQPRCAELCTAEDETQ